MWTMFCLRGYVDDIALQVSAYIADLCAHRIKGQLDLLQAALRRDNMVPNGTKQQVLGLTTNVRKASERVGGNATAVAALARAAQGTRVTESLCGSECHSITANSNTCGGSDVRLWATARGGGPTGSGCLCGRRRQVGP